MKNTNFTCRLCLFVSLCFFLGSELRAYELKQYTTKEGLSGNAVTSIYQDGDGFVWLGSENGLNRFDGMSVWNSALFAAEADSLLNDSIGDLFETEEQQFWILTRGGLVRCDNRKQSVHRFEGFNLQSKITKGPDSHLYAIKEDHSIHYYRKDTEAFEKIAARGVIAEDILSMFVDKENILWIFTNGNKHFSFSIEREEDEVKLTLLNSFRHPEAMLWCSYGDQEVYFVDDSFVLFEYDLSSKTKHYIQEMRAEIARYGDVSSIIKHQGDYLVGFANGGLIRIESLPDQRQKYQTTEIPVKGGINCLRKDDRQEIVWVGTKEEGVYLLYNEAATLDGILSNTFPYEITTPLNALHLDKSNTLWIGTAGNGIVKMPSFTSEGVENETSEWFSTHNSLLGSATVRGFSASAKNIFWIGTENGINYYSYSEKRVKSLQLMAEGKPVKRVRSVCELNDTTLWVVTADEGLVKARLAGTADAPMITEAKRMVVLSEEGESVSFTVAYKESESIVWLGTDGAGVYKVDTNSEKMNHTLFGKSGEGINTVYSILKTYDGYWFGTGGGLLFQRGSTKKIFNEESGFLHKHVYGILEGNNNHLWLSTDEGIVRYDKEKESFYLCRQTDNRQVTSFTAGACYKENSVGMLLFGGGNGLVAINETAFAPRDFSPEVKLTGLSIFGKKQNLFDYLRQKKDRKTIRINHDQLVFALSFVAPDYIDGESYTYLYRLKGQGGSWVDNGHSGVAHFSYLSPGRYTLLAKYRNNVTRKESKEYQLKIQILPPWYKTWWAYAIYLLIIASVVYVVRIVLLWRNRGKSEAPIAAAEPLVEKPVEVSTLEKESDKPQTDKPVDDKAFYEEVLRFIEKNVSNTELSVELLSAEMQLSTHQLYRRLKRFTDKTPNEMIRDLRLGVVEKLLVSTNLSVDEIMEKAGFQSRSNFFKIFAQKHDMTPKAYRDARKGSGRKKS